MSQPVSGCGESAATIALRQRLGTVKAVLIEGAPGSSEAAGSSFYESLVELTAQVGKNRSPADIWLLLVGLTGAMPDRALVRSVTRALALKEPEDSVVWLLDAVAPLAMRDGHAEATLRIESERPLVDVNFTAKSNFLTGIQRVVRSVAAEWSGNHDIELVVWTARGGAYRTLTDSERALLLEREVAEFDAAARLPGSDRSEVVVPWGVPVVLTEVPPLRENDRLAALAEATPNSISIVGYDCIPMSSAETVPLVEPEKFGRYLELVKHADRLAGISGAAAAEFAGFGRALSAQGLRGPRVVACPLPESVPVTGTRTGTSHSVSANSRPLVLSIGTVGRRKNQTALVEAAEMLWRQGLDFELRLLGHVAAERSPLVGLVPELQEQGRHLVIESGVSDARIADSFSQARCLAFPSLHEGFGLPIVEALSHGVPVITSDFGSAREVAEGKGGLLVDPEDVDALAEAIRRVLTDDELHAQLVAEAGARPIRSWADYADDLWEALLG